MASPPRGLYTGEFHAFARSRGIWEEYLNRYGGLPHVVRDVAAACRGGRAPRGRGLREHVENRRDDTVVDARIEIGLLGDQRDPRAPAAGVRDGHTGRDPGALGYRVGGNHAAVDGPGERDDPKGPALQLAIGLFFTGGKKAVEINVQLLWGSGLSHPRTIAK